MGYALHRITKVLGESINSPSFPAADWVVAMKNEANVTTIINLQAANVPTKYWAIDQPGSVIREMTPAEKAVVDADEAAQLPAKIDAEREAKLAEEIDFVESVERAAALVVLDGFNAHALKVKELLDQVDLATSLADLKTRYAAITDIPQRTPAQVRAAIKAKLGT